MERKTPVDSRWNNILDKDILKGSINIVSLFITVYELLEDTIISRPKDFYTIIEFDVEAKKRYHENVLSLYDKSALSGINSKNKEFISSIIWFKNNKAIDEEDVKVIADSRTLRNKLTHEMLYMIAEGGDKLIDQFVLMYGLFCKIEKWWILEIEFPINGISPDLTDEEQQGVMSGHMLVLEAIIDILANDSNVHFKEACKNLGIPVR